MAKVFISHRGFEAEQRYAGLALRTFDAAGLARLALRGHAAPPPLSKLYVPLRVTSRGLPFPVGEVLKAPRRCVILGEAGTGKTTLVHWLATAYLQKARMAPIEWIRLPGVSTLPNDPLLPVVVSCRDLDPADAPGSLDDFLCHALHQAGMSEADAAPLVCHLRERLQVGHVLLLIDGLDAISAPQSRADFCRLIERIANDHPRTPVVVTSRPEAYRDLGSPLSFEAVSVADWPPEDQDRFVQQWFRWSEPQPARRERETDEMVLAIHSRRQERQAGNPLHLTLMALLKPKLGALPSRRAELYGEAVKLLLGRLPGGGALREVLPQLEYLAWVLCERGLQQLPLPAALEALAAFRAGLPPSHPVHAQSPEELLHNAERTGLLRTAGERPVVEICHPVFQEFLAARAVVHGHTPEPADRPLAQRIAALASRSDPWPEVLRLAVACSGGAGSEALRALLPLAAEDARGAECRARTVLAARCLAEEPEADEAIAWQVSSRLAGHVGQAEGSPQTRTPLDQAVQELLGSRWAALLELALVREFQARPSEERWSIGFYFAKLGAMPELTELDAGSGLAVTQDDLNVAAALAVIGSPASFSGGDLAPRFLAMLGGGEARGHAAAWALYSLHGPREGAWRPTAAERERLTALLGDPRLDAAAAWCVRKVLGAAGSRRVR
ncbi:MAG TPA: NACHT domain-containing protein [Thermoanaerobaculia bacterium]|nr:NACHT domain-containing protein [Thermoanaerobaculia bacterium]